MPIKLGIIGLSAQPSAWATRAHLGPIKSKLSDKYTLTAVGASTEDSARAAAEAHGLPPNKAYSDAEKLANDPDVEMVVVSVKVPEHKMLVLPALRAGKDVFVEWPLGNGVEEAREMAALARKMNVKTMVGLQARHAGSILKARELIRSGVLGRIISSTITGHDSLHHRLPESQAYSVDIANGANFITIACGHALDAICFLLGEFEWLSASTRINFPACEITHRDGSVGTVPRTSPDYLALHGCVDGGVGVSLTYFNTSDMGPSEVKWTIVGEKGALKFEGRNYMIQAASPALFRSEGQGDGFRWIPVEVDSPMAWGGVGELYEAFADGSDVVDFDAAVKRHEMIEAIYRSAETGKRESY